MSLKIQIPFVLLFIVVVLSSCSQGGRMHHPSIENKNDTLNISYADTVLTGRLIFPTTLDSDKLEGLTNENTLLSFESGNYYYVLYNRKKEVDFLSLDYWNKLVPKYLNLPNGDSLNHFRFVRIKYPDGPFLTGFYNKKDSIIVHTSHLRKKDLENISKLYVNYFSTTDTLFKLNGNVSVNDNLKDVISKLHIPDKVEIGRKLKIVLMEATSLIDNAWYKLYPDCYSDDSVSVVLTFDKNRLIRIEYLDSEYVYYLFRQKHVITKDIHYH